MDNPRGGRRPRRFVVDPGSFDCLNLGDVAMLQVAVSRIRSIERDSVIQVLTADPAALRRHCPEVEPLDDASRRVLLSDHDLLGRVHHMLPQVCSRQLVRLKRTLRRRSPGLVASMMNLKGRIRGTEGNDGVAFLSAMRNADLLLVAGQGTLNDRFTGHAAMILETLEIAVRAGVPAALSGQGIGPLENAELRARARAVLPRAGLIALRERETSHPLLRRLGVREECIVTTGDDALELAYGERPETAGNGIGVNLRVAEHSGVEAEFIGKLRSLLHRIGRKYAAPLLPLPIALHAGSRDHEVLRELLAGYGVVEDDPAALDTPLKVIRTAGRCRLVVTGAYHAAVFALGQGVPAVCLSATRYYDDKFRGLRAQFGPGCEVVSLESWNAAAELSDAIERIWVSAGVLGPLLRRKTVRQIESGMLAYRRIMKLAAPGRAAA